MLEVIQQNSDLILTVCSLAFSISLFPTVVHNYKNKVCEIPYMTSVPTVFFLALVTLVYISNSFVMSSIVGAATMSVWAGIALQRFIYNKVVK